MRFVFHRRKRYICLHFDLHRRGRTRVFSFPLLFEKDKRKSGLYSSALIRKGKEWGCDFLRTPGGRTRSNGFQTEENERPSLWKRKEGSESSFIEKNLLNIFSGKGGEKHVRERKREGIPPLS